MAQAAHGNTAELNQPNLMADFGSSIIAYFGGDTKGLENAVSRAETVVGSFQSAMNKIGIGIGTAAVIGFFKNVLDNAGRINDMSDALGVSTTALQAFQSQAALAGIEVQDVAKLLSNTRNKVDELAAGNEQTAKSFAKLGLTQKDLVGIPLEAALEKISAAYVKNQDKAGAYAAVIDIVGARSAKMMGLLQELGTNGFGAMEAAARSAGNVIEDETIKRLDSLGDRITQVKGKMITWGSAALELGMNITEGLGAAAAWVVNSFEGIDTAVVPTVDSVQKLEGAVVKLEDTMKGTAGTAKDFASFNEGEFKREVERLEMKGDKQGKLNALLRMASLYIKEAGQYSENSKEQLENVAKANALILEYDKEQAKLRDRVRLSHELEVELVKLKSKNVNELTEAERVRLKVLELMTKEKKLQVEIDDLVEKQMTGKITPAEKEQLTLKFKQLDAIKQQIVELQKVPAAIQPAIDKSEEWLRSITKVSRTMSGIGTSSQWGNESNRVLEEMLRRKKAEKTDLEFQLAGAPRDPLGGTQMAFQSEIAVLGATIDNISKELQRRQESVRTLQTQGAEAAFSQYTGDPRSFERFIQLALGNDTKNLAMQKDMEQIRMMLQNFFGR